MRIAFLLASVALHLAAGQQGSNFGQALAGGITGVLVDTFFPKLKPSLLKGNSPALSPSPPQPPPGSLRQQQGPQISISSAKSPSSNVPSALTGLGQLPPVDFPHGFPPTFVGLTNPENQKGFNIPAGLQGRTDLPSDYVYPFAARGSIIQPDLRNGDVYSLGLPPSRQTNQAPISGPIDSPQAVLQQPAAIDSLLQPVGPNALLSGGGLAPSAGLQALGSQPSSNGVQSPVPDQPAPKPVQDYGIRCPDCVPIDLRRSAGPWIQVYGNPNSLRNIYTAIANLQSFYVNPSAGDQVPSIQPICVGMQISRPKSQGDNRSESALNLYYRDDTVDRQLREANGVLKRRAGNNFDGVVFKLPSFELPMCLVKAGPETSTMYGYIILTETLGDNRCRSYHVFARRADAFIRDHNTEVVEFIKSRVESEALLPVGVLSHPELCQLPTTVTSAIFR